MKAENNDLKPHSTQPFHRLHPYMWSGTDSELQSDVLVSAAAAAQPSVQRGAEVSVQRDVLTSAAEVSSTGTADTAAVLSERTVTIQESHKVTRSATLCKYIIRGPL